MTTLVADPSTPAVRTSRDVRIRTIAPLACVLIVTLRLFIGWQFLYEGLWKYDKQSSADPWTAEGYLANAQGPLRSVFRDMTGDPDGLQWLDYDAVAAKWDRYADRFASHYDLDEDQQSRLDAVLNGEKQFTAPVGKLPEQVTLFDENDRSSWARKIRAVARFEDGQLIVDGDEPLLPSEIAHMKSLVDITRDPNGFAIYDAGTEGEPKIERETDPRKLSAPPEEIAWFRAVERLETLQDRGLGYKRRLAAALKGDPDRVGVVGRLQEDGSRYVPEMGTATRAELAQRAADDVIIRYGEQKVYRDLLDEYEALVTSRDLQFKQDHAAALIGKVRAKKQEVIGPIETMDADFRTDAAAILASDQFRRGELKPEATPLSQASSAAMWGLLILGTLLLLGLATPLAALAGAVMLLNFYLVWPPWPGVPDAPGPEHALVVDKNLIECVALLAIAAMPTGRWFGLDGLLAWVYRRATSKTTVA